jgi:hypothetical protein
VHAESLQHFSRSSEADRLALLPDRKRRQINRHDSILTEWQPVVRVTSDLQNEVAVSALVQHFVPWRLPNRQPTQGTRVDRGLDLVPRIPLPDCDGVLGLGAIAVGQVGDGQRGDVAVQYAASFFFFAVVFFFVRPMASR